jgi:hypothetical protein
LETKAGMTIQKRLIFVAAFFAFALVLYGAGKHYSAPLVLHVVEQSLVQKAPAGMDPAQIRERLHAFLAAAPDQEKKMKSLLRLSEYLEKVQCLTPEEFNELLPGEKTAAVPAP